MVEIYFGFQVWPKRSSGSCRISLEFQFISAISLLYISLMDSPAFHTEIMIQSLTAVYFYTTGCAGCKSMKLKISLRMVSDSLFRLIMVDCEISSWESGQYLIFTVPTSILFLNGREFRRFSRFIDLTDVESTIFRMRSIQASGVESDPAQI